MCIRDRINIASTKTAPVAKRVILLNRKEQRLDPKLPKADVITNHRLHELIAQHKLCNTFHITGKCEDGSYCQYHHGERLEAKLQNALRHKARTQSCGLGGICRSFDCVAGHHCQRDPCPAGIGCWFAASHGMDTEAKMQLTEDGRTEAL